MKRTCRQLRLLLDQGGELTPEEVGARLQQVLGAAGREQRRLWWGALLMADTTEHMQQAHHV